MYRMTIYSRAMPKRDGPRGDDRPALAGPATLILSSLAGGPKHGYALTKDVEEFAGVHLAPGTLYEALARLESQGLIEALEPADRRRPYRLTAAGATALQAHLDAQRRVTDTGLRRLRANWGTS
jgi:DNA-binding PadR family transcriptional regulator